MKEDTSFRVISKGKDYIWVEVINYDNTILRPLVEEIANDPMVLESRYNIEHPTLDNPKIYIRVKEGKPQAAIKRAMRKLEKTFEDLENEVKKSLQ
ncbi:MAG: DNA-directed RNA polymerase subunit L [Thermoplasmata archaeon]|jgi:DNA-directed RNA polymerase subunit L|nr:DNA-directed RNA polymerase subunit L [Thermoplasmatales archaeon]PMP74815.1 MAG: DNA-directed RNA polymerase subunit L [Aciduliprofundum sp.]HEU12499.1 DNA-directed RNA polymerase subunit L [Euryarchaeota archaeon]